MEVPLRMACWGHTGVTRCNPGAVTAPAAHLHVIAMAGLHAHGLRHRSRRHKSGVPVVLRGRRRNLIRR